MGLYWADKDALQFTHRAPFPGLETSTALASPAAVHPAWTRCSHGSGWPRCLRRPGACQATSLLRLIIAGFTLRSSFTPPSSGALPSCSSSLLAGCCRPAAVLGPNVGWLANTASASAGPGAPRRRRQCHPSPHGYGGPYGLISLSAHGGRLR